MMQLHTPLGLLLMALAGVVLLLHALRPRYTPKKVPSLRLWHSVTEALSLQARWRRVVRSLLLLVHLLIVVFLALAVAEPTLTLRRASSHNVHIVDASASMLATDVAPNRFSVALEQAADQIREERGLWTVISAGAAPRILYQGSSRRDAVTALLSSSPETGSVNWKAIVDLFDTLREEPTSITLWTDGGNPVDALHPFLQRAGERLAVRVVGSESPFNVGITAFDARRSGEDPLQYEALVAVRNFSRQHASGQIRVTAGDVEFLSTPFDLKPDEGLAYTFPFRLEGIAELSAALDVADHFPFDNPARIDVRGFETTRVALVGPRNRHLENVLRAFPQVDFDVRLFVGPDDLYHLRIYDRLPYDEHPGVQLVFAPPSSEPWIPGPTIVWWDPVHPLTRYVDWGSVRIARAKPLPVGSATQVLVDSTAGPLVTLERREEGLLIQVGFALDDSDLAQRVAFPVFMDGLLQLAHTAAWEPIQPAILPPLDEAALTRYMEPTQSVEKAEARTVLRKLWPPLIAGVLLLLFFEGWLFQNRGGNVRCLLRQRSSLEKRREAGGVQG